MSASFIRVDRLEHDIVLLTLSKPDSLNAIDTAGLEELRSALHAITSDGSARALVLTGSGRAFCAGADLKEVSTFSPERAGDFALAGHDVFSLIESFPSPTIAALNGPALGGGLELACACDLVLAASGAVCAQPEVRVGMIAGWGATARLVERIGIGRARKLLFTGETISSETAVAIGLVDAVFPQSGFMEEVERLAATIARNAPIAVRLTKSLLQRELTHRTRTREADAAALVECVMSQDQTEGITAFLEKRPASFRGC